MSIMAGAVPFNDNDDNTPEDLQTTDRKRRQEMTRTPEVCMRVASYVCI